MIDWTKPMSQRFEYYKVSPNLWEDEELLSTVSSGSISRDLGTDTLGSASFTVDEMPPECYVRAYLVCTQNGLTHKECLGTYLLQTPTKRFNGIRKTISVQSYTPLIELKEKYTPICYTINKGSDVVPLMLENLSNNMRAPVVRDFAKVKLTDYDIIAQPEDSWMQYMVNVLNQNKLGYKLDAYGRFYLYEATPIEAKVPVWYYADNKDSIIYQDITYSQDLYNVPNVYEVYISLPEGTANVRVVNDDPNSPTSTVSRGREIVYRETSPSLTGIPTQVELENYARRRLKELSTITVDVSYTHSYCPVTIGDAVRIDYKAAGLTGIKAIVKSQTIDLSVGCKVSETASFTTTYWR